MALDLAAASAPYEGIPTGKLRPTAPPGCKRLWAMDSGSASRCRFLYGHFGYPPSIPSSGAEFSEI